MAATIAVAGGLAQRPRRGGHAWVFLTWLLGLRRLGWDVVFVDRLEPAWIGEPVEGSAPARWLSEVMHHFGLAGDWALLHDGTRTLGLTRQDLADRLDDAALLINVMGYLDDPDLLARPARRAYLDLDPGWPQMWRNLGLHDGLGGHDAHVTVGRNVGLDICAIPTCGIDWIATPPPVLLDAWPAQPPPSDGAGAFTSVATWRGPNAPMDYEGRRYGVRAHAFRALASLPRETDATFRVALDIDPADEDDRALLEAGGWELADPLAVAGDPDAYRDFVQGSRAELMVAKDLYARTCSGWFSDRSAAYLASGRPVLAQDTGFPAGRNGGLLTFSTAQEARAGVAELLRDPAGHAVAARVLAEERFASDRILGELLERLEVT
ncbi:MAG: hypothetical protein JWO74_4299 [Solirubrobacterales bacterium]|nr:hypothetical protein [Solirubrobacterales bacterium]